MSVCTSPSIPDSIIIPTCSVAATLVEHLFFHKQTMPTPAITNVLYRNSHPNIAGRPKRLRVEKGILRYSTWLETENVSWVFTRYGEHSRLT